MTGEPFRLVLVVDNAKIRSMSGGDLDQWGSWLRASGASAGTIRLRECYVTRFLAAHPDLHAVSLDDVMEFLGRPGWAPETRRAARSSLRSYFRWAVLSGRLEADPTVNAPTVAVPPGIPHPVTEDVVARALDKATDEVRLMLLLAAYAGLRRAEIAKVHSSHVSDLGLRVDGKGGRVRLVPIHPMLADDLGPVRGWAFPSPVFPGRPVHPDYVGKRVKRALGGPWTTHSCRHRFATQAYAGTRDLRAVQTLLGHSKPETTARYVAVSHQDLVAAVAAVA